MAGADNSLSRDARRFGGFHGRIRCRSVYLYLVLKMRKTLIQVFLYVLFLLLFLEIFTRLIFAVPGFASRLQADEKTTYLRRWVAKHKTGVEITYAFDVYDGTKGWMMKAGLRHQQEGIARTA